MTIYITYLAFGAIIDIFFQMAVYLFKRHVSPHLSGKSIWKKMTAGTCFYTLYLFAWPIFLIWFIVAKLIDGEEREYE